MHNSHNLLKITITIIPDSGLNYQNNLSRVGHHHKSHTGKVSNISGRSRLSMI